MGIMRTFGLIFFMTILIGGCVAATSEAPPPDPVSFSTQAVSWETALSLIQQGEASAVSQAPNLTVYLTLADGTQLITRAPVSTALHDAIVRCGQPCGFLDTVNL